MAKIKSTNFNEIITNKHLPGLDGIRAISVLAVIVSHAGAIPLGGLAVNTFFVLSGFLISWLLLNEWNKSSDISLRKFYLRRTLRIFPAYYFFIIVTITADLVLGSEEIKPAILPALTYTMNYFNVFYDHPPLSVGHTWSLAIEEQFYLIWPALLLIVLRVNNKLLIPMLMMIILCCVAWRSFAYAYFEFGTSYVYNAFETRVDSLAIGCLLAVLLQNQSIQKLVDKGATMPVLSVLAFVLVVWFHTSGTFYYRYTVGYTVSSLLTAFLLTQLMALSTYGIWRFLEYSPIRYIGIISYPIYLWHGRCLELTEKIGISGVWFKVLIGALICVVVASCSYFLIEKPFLKLKQRFY